ncbi:MAG: DUF2726 domain-containing protein [Planctomycetota bacterium]
MPLLFDSDSEKRAYTKVRTHWQKYLDVYPQVPVRKALGYDKLKNLSISDQAREYLLKTEFDFVVCDRSASPILAVEFDGLGHGFSRHGKYIQVVKTEDPHRKLKLDAKINACECCGLPIVVVSYPEIEPADDPDCPVMVLDGVIGEVLASQKFQKLLRSNLDQLSEALENDPSGETAQLDLWGLEILADEENPIRRRIQEMTRELPDAIGRRIHGERIHPLKDRPGYIGARQEIVGGIHISEQLSRRQVLLSYDAYVRTLNCPGCHAFCLANLLAQYGLARKAIRTVGKSTDAWQKLLQGTPWTED